MNRAFKCSASGEPYNRVLNVYNTPNQLKKAFYQMSGSSISVGHRSKYLYSDEENNRLSVSSSGHEFSPALSPSIVSMNKNGILSLHKMLLYTSSETQKLSAYIWRCHLNLKMHP